MITKSPMFTNTATKSPLHRRIGRGLWRTLKLLVLASGPAGAVFGFLAWQEAKSSSPDMTASARNTAEMLVVQVEMLKTLGKALPEQERARLGIDRLITIAEASLAGATDRPGTPATDPASMSRRHRVTPRGPSTEALGIGLNRLAEQLWKTETPN